MSTFRVNEITKEYAKDTYAQLVVAFTDGLTFFDQNKKLLFFYDKNEPGKTANSYTVDDRRLSFPLNEYPMYQTNVDGQIRLLVKNIVDYDKIYVAIRTNEGLTQTIYYRVLKDTEGAIVVFDTELSDVFSKDINEIKKLLKERENEKEINDFFNSLDEVSKDKTLSLNN